MGRCMQENLSLALFRMGGREKQLMEGTQKKLPVESIK